MYGYLKYMLKHFLCKWLQCIRLALFYFIFLNYIFNYFYSLYLNFRFYEACSFTGYSFKVAFPTIVKPNYSTSFQDHAL